MKVLKISLFYLKKTFMAIEIERKFLTNQLVKKALMAERGNYIKQGYLTTDPDKTVRIRISNELAFITIKGKGYVSRPEFEYEIPLEEAIQMLDLFAGQIIEKTRYKIEFKNYTWEVDVFHGENEGLILAELEIGSEEEEFPVPAWIYKEVTGDKRYYNSYLSLHAYKNWNVG